MVPRSANLLAPSKFVEAWYYLVEHAEFLYGRYFCFFSRALLRNETLSPLTASIFHGVRRPPIAVSQLPFHFRVWSPLAPSIVIAATAAAFVLISHHWCKPPSVAMGVSSLPNDGGGESASGNRTVSLFAPGAMIANAISADRAPDQNASPQDSTPAIPPLENALDQTPSEAVGLTGVAVMHV